MSELAGIWAQLEPAHEFLTSIALSLLTTFALWLFSARVVIVWGSASTNYHFFDLAPERGGGKASIWAEKFYIQNTGRKSANNIELVFSDAPSSYSLWAKRDHTSNVLPGGGLSIKVPSLAPRELLIVDMIDIDNKSVRLLSVNCPDVLARQVPFVPTRQFGPLFNILIGILMFAGLIAAFYVLIRLVLGALQ
ncbi:hypothetical protein PUH89_17005 [Rhodobacter capsulatus]|uniref:hypothetical protein n=1 Tax=Rhodobacter capsulatus TaxID=1061 RepID=UPI001113B19D|nr:hypothetical protein [Rhodobacter capsulatus]WER08981.1 hypothetical protein PUH89_17005 [Rhodobacter capsulatus]